MFNQREVGFHQKWTFSAIAAYVLSFTSFHTYHTTVLTIRKMEEEKDMENSKKVSTNTGNTRKAHTS